MRLAPVRFVTADLMQCEKYEAVTMKITKRQLRRIIREEKNRLLNEQIPPDDPYASVGGPDPGPQMSGKTASAVQDLQTAYVNLEDLANGIVGYPRGAETSDEILMNLELIKNAIHLLGANLP